MSIQRILAVDRNEIPSATLTASAVAGSAQVYLQSATRSGNGSVALSGSYSGTSDATIDIQIVDTTGTGRLSVPVFRGVGSGSITTVSAGTLPQQDITITLADMGISTTAAEVDFYGVTLRAKVPGTSGNSISITVDESSLVDTVGRLTTFADISASATALVGPQYDFGAVALGAGGVLPADAPRLRFVGDPQIFRQYKRYLNNQWEYHLVPSPPRGIAKGSAVAVVTGAYSVTVTQGGTTETYSATTLYDFLAALIDSTLVEVSGAVVKDLSPGGMATLDLPLKTSAYHLPVETSRGRALDSLSVITTAPTEIVELTCIDDSLLGAEVWSVKGSTSGTLSQARTSIAYSDPAAPVSFTIPAWMPEIQSSAAAGPAVSLKTVSYASRTDAEVSPEILVRQGAVGIAGKSMELKAVYTKYKRTVNCNALEATLTGSITAECLGLTSSLITGGDIMALDTAYQTRLVSLYQWSKTALGFESNFLKTAVYGYATYTSAGNWTIIAIGHEQSVRDLTIPTKLGTVTGLPTSQSLNTAYPAAVNGNNVWFDIAANTIVTQINFNKGDVALIQATTQIMAECLALVWSSAPGLTAYDAWVTEVETEMVIWQLNNSDNYALTQPLNTGYSTDFTTLLDKYRAGANAVLAAAGIVPGKSEGSAVSTGCWTEKAQDYWEIEGYAPAYTNTAYISTKFSSDGAPYSSKEFGFYIACKCAANLKYGDTLTIQINNSSTTSKTYQTGDTFKIPVIAATPLQLSGGQTGNDTVTWNVRGMTSGTLDSYPVVNDTPARYTDAATGFSFDMTLGGIPFALGDSFSLSAEGGHFQWRKNSGAWSSSVPLADTLLSDGLTAVFSPGAAPSLASGDYFHFVAKQPGAPANVSTPDAAGWSFTGNSATLTAIWAAAVTLDTIGLARMTGTPTFEYSIDGTTAWTALPAVTVARGVKVAVLAAPITVKGLRLTVAKTGGASVGWLWAGRALSTDYAPQDMKLRRVFDMVRGPKDATALAIGNAWAGEVGWTLMSSTDFDNHLEMIEACKTANDAPIIFIPHYLHPEEAVFVKIQSDSIDLVDEYQFHPDDSTKRLQSLTIPFAPVYN